MIIITIIIVITRTITLIRTTIIINDSSTMLTKTEPIIHKYITTT